MPRMLPTRKFHNYLFDIVLLTLVASLIFGALLGARPYSAPSEARYVEIGREMAESGNYITPRLNYVKYFEKPPLFYWVQAAWTKVAGTGFFASRAPTAAFAVMLCLLTYMLGRMLYGRGAGIMGALVLSTTLYLFSLSRVVLLDVPVSLFLAGTLAGFLYAANAPDGRRRNISIYGMYVMAALSVMTKGLIGIVLPGAVIFLWLACTSRWKLLLQMRLISGTLLFLFIAVPWHIVVWQHNPEHPWFYFVHEHWIRYTTKEHGRYEPTWFFAVVLAAGLFPWLVFAPQAVAAGLKNFWQERRSDGVKLFLFIWIVFIFLFFSKSDSKLIPYILPIFPPIAAMMGHYFLGFWREDESYTARLSLGFNLGILLMMALLLGMAAAPSLLQSLTDEKSKIAITLKQGGNDVSNLSLACMISAIVLFMTYIQGQKKHIISVCLVIAIMLCELGDGVAAHYSKDSMHAFAEVLNSTRKPGDEFVTYDNYYQDLPIYLNSRVTVVHWKGELEYGTQHEDTSAWMIGYDEFWKRVNTPDHRMFVIMRDDAYERIKAVKPTPEASHLYPLLQDGRNILFTNVSPNKPTQQTGK